MVLISAVEEAYKKQDITDFEVGDTVKVYVKVVEGDKERLQPYEGVVISKKGSGTRESFTVRKISFGIGVERVFPLHSPSIAKIEVVKKGDVRRAKLYYLRSKKGKHAKIKERSREMLQKDSVLGTA